jgi:hypothetical protein
VQKYLIILFIFLCGNKWVSAQGSNIAQTEKELIEIYGKLTASKYGDFDSLEYFSNLFSSKFEQLISSDPKTLKHSFRKLVDAYVCNVETSKDGLFRIYSWDSQLGGTMRFFNVIYQYKSGETVKTQRYSSTFEGDPAWFCSEIFTLKTGKKTHYLGITNGIYSSKDVSQSIRAFELTDKGVNDSIALFKTEEGLTNSLSVYYDFFSVVDRPERPVSIIRYDERKKQITLECVSVKEKIIPNCYTFYQFNGICFEESSWEMR